MSSCINASTATTILPTDRVLFKRCKIDVEDDANKTGQSPKLVLPKSILLNAKSSIRVKTDVDDIHLYALSPWVIRLIQVRTGLSSIQKEVIPLLTSRQFKGVQAAFGSNINKLSEEKLDVLKKILPTMWQAVKSSSFTDFSYSSIASRVAGDDVEQDDAYYVGEEDDAYMAGESEKDVRRFQPLPYHVAAAVLPRGQRLILRACSINHYSYASRELVSHAAKAPTKEELLSNNTPHQTCMPTFVASPGAEEVLHSALMSAFTPLQGTVSSKFNTLILPDTNMGEKVTTKSCTIGRHCTIGNKCRLNNVVIMDHVQIGDNCVLQNSVIGEGAVVGENCNFNDVQVGPGAKIRSGTKCKNESIVGGDGSMPLGDSDDDEFDDD